LKVGVIVVAKAPAAGRTKTRLCPPCTPDEAAAIAEAALADTLHTVASTVAAFRVLALDGEAGPWLPDGFELVAQQGDGLDERLACAFSRGPAVLIGTDTPQVTNRMLLAAMTALMDPRFDAVLGEAVDGGFWIIGLREPDPQVFLGVPMSSAFTARVQRQRLRTLGYAVGELPRLRDVDVFDDALAVARIMGPSRFRMCVGAIAGATRSRASSS
jgi:rSAM/selenodomain-associated transferase 1